MALAKIIDSDLVSYVDRLKDQVVLVTGASGHLGRAVALEMASRGAKVVLGDHSDTQPTVDAIIATGGVATGCILSPGNYDEQRVMFETAVETYGSVDSIRNNIFMRSYATCTMFEDQVTLDPDGLPTKPAFEGLQDNLVSVVHCSLKSVVLLGSLGTILILEHLRCSMNNKCHVLVGSYKEFPHDPIYAASMSGALGLVHSLSGSFKPAGIRISCVDVDVEDFSILSNVNIAAFNPGLDRPPFERLVRAIIYCAVDPDMATTGLTWIVLPDPDGGVLRLELECFKKGAYALTPGRLANIAR
ncbi:NAD(P)-binding protein [Fistulina hepatica ATCC 64428]|uniref:NAD(P)-binding protein n=1 Tax=Fistulina hepatica ATCC 64428 TaxID=1128425 RepID=A0A0D7AA33_9AGAR|nr:NAD(P)-binding protein [Fistulina hepatica ATCC 64428]